MSKKESEGCASTKWMWKEVTGDLVNVLGRRPKSLLEVRKVNR